MDNSNLNRKEGSIMKDNKVYSFEEKQEQRKSEIKLKAQKLVLRYLLKVEQQNREMKEQEKVREMFSESIEEAIQKEKFKQDVEILNYAQTNFKDLYRCARASINQVEWYCNKKKERSQEEAKQEYIKEREKLLFYPKTKNKDKEMIELSIDCFDQIYENHMQKLQSKIPPALLKKEVTSTEAKSNIALGRISELAQRTDPKEAPKAIDCPIIRNKKIVWEKTKGDGR